MIRLYVVYVHINVALSHWDNTKTKQLPFSKRHFEIEFFNQNVSISIKIPLKFVHMGQINNIPALIQTMAWQSKGIKLYKYFNLDLNLGQATESGPLQTPWKWIATIKK